jgi:lipopolysaccharide/colanic/teichoic acid biosynthesis glycosyltransferase
MIKRLFDVVVSLITLVVLAPVLLGIAVAIKFDSRGPVFFRQERVGLQGRIFRIHKFRTMVADAEHRGLQLTSPDDARITPVGALLRRHKLDELAQLIDVLQGDMSIVGPRPEVPRYVALYPPEVRQVVLSVRPGITDAASVAYRNEAAHLSSSDDPEQLYINVLMPAKLKLCMEYVRNHSLGRDVLILVQTLAALLRP